jgi:serine/threonine-protein kinase
MTIDERYELTDFIGAGGMACVYKAYEHGSPHAYALKFLKPQYHNQEYLIRFFEQEADNMKNLAHPNIVRFYRFVNRTYYSYIIMDYIEGYSLTEIIKAMYAQQRDIPLDEIVRIMVQVARALEAIHRENFVHRDIKPGNVLISTAEGSKGKAYLTDLGITTAKDVEMVGAGTLAYMSPEQAGRGIVDHRADIYAYGIMMFELIAKQRPFRVEKGLAGKDAEYSLVRQHREAPVPEITAFREGLPPELNAIMAKALAKNPDERYQNVLDFARAVHEALQTRLSADLQDFNAITHVKFTAPSASGITSTAPSIPVRPPTLKPVTEPTLPPGEGRPARLWLVGAIAGIFLVGIVVMMLLVFSLGVLLGGQPTPTVVVQAASATTTLSLTHTVTTVAPSATIPTATHTPTPTTTHTPTHTPTATATHTLTPSPTPTATHTLTPSPTTTYTLTPTHTPSPTNTASPLPATGGSTNNATALGSVEGFLLVRGNNALSAPLDSRRIVIPSAKLAYLRVGTVQDFRLSYNVMLDNIQRLGAAFRIVDAQNYHLFTITPAGKWQLQQFTANVPATLNEGQLSNVNNALLIALQGNTLYISAGNEPITGTLGAGNGSLALYIEATTPEIVLDSLSVELLGEDRTAALQTSPTPAVGLASARQRLASDVLLLLATRNSADLSINCPAFIPIFDRFDTYFTASDAAEAARGARRASEVIYNRCVAESPDARLSFQEGVQDYNTWEAALLNLANTLQE